MTMNPGHPVYLDCNATTPIAEEVLEAMIHYCRTEYGNAGSRTHPYGAAAAKAVRRAREQVAEVVAASWEDVVFTSGATESNNLAILGLAAEAQRSGKRHIVSTQIEHKAVLEPLEELVSRGFEVTLVPPSADGVVDPRAIISALRGDTFLVSVMHVNNETGVVQPLGAISDLLGDHPAAFHTDAAQGFGKELEGLRTGRIDLISVSGHKIFGPKGVGALIVRSRDRPLRIRPLMFGGGQERGLRPGTSPVHLAVGLGVAAESAVRNHDMRRKTCEAFREALLRALAPFNPTIHGNPALVMPHVLNIRFDEMDSEAVMLSLRAVVAISNGSACTSTSSTPSHVLKAMGLSNAQADAATRWSWCHLTPQIDWTAVTEGIKQLY
jgi:cysteine desulfurase